MSIFIGFIDITIKVKTMTAWQASSPYNALPSLPPIQDVETKKVLKLCIEAKGGTG